MYSMKNETSAKAGHLKPNS